MSVGQAIGSVAKWAARALAALLLLVLALLIAFRIAAWVREGEEGLAAGSRIVATPLGGVAIREAGPADGPRILLVPGTAAGGGFWRDVSAHLAARGWRVISVDLPPFGYSEHDPEARYDRASQAARLAAVIGARRPALVLGHSFGAGAVVELALRAPERVRALVLVDASLGRLDPPEGSGAGATAAVLRQRWIAQPLVSASLTNPWALRPLMRSMLARKDAADVWMETIRAPMRRRGTTAAYAAWLPQLFAANDASLSRRSSNLARIAMPVHLIWGEADNVTPIAQGEALARLLRARSFARLPGVGHVPHIEDPAGFLAALDAAIGEAR